MNHPKRALTNAAPLSVFHLVRKGVGLLGLALLVSWPGSSAWAGGSFALEDLKPILQQEPVMAKWLTDGLEFAETGDAVRIGQNVNPRFGGLRIGPYVILAKPKGASGPFTLEVTVETELISRNAAGKDVDVSQAQVIREKFASVSVRPYKERGPNPSWETWPIGGQERHMLKKCLAFMVIIGLIGSVALAADEFPYDKEQIGKLHLGLSEKEVRQIIPGQPTRGAEQLQGADGEYHQEWQYAAAGITLGMVAKKKGGHKSLESITITSPSLLQTQRGIRIGSTEAEVIKAYGPFRNAEDSKPGELLVAGSIFGGVMFDFQQGRVNRIFIGAAAE